MSQEEIFCPNCGGKHTKKGKFCEFCGTDLEEIIMSYKSKQLPVRYQATEYSGPVQQSSRSQRYGTEDYYEDRSYRRRDSSGFWDVLLSVLFFWMCCGPDCD